MNKLLFSYLIGKLRKNPFKKILSIILLIPVFSIIQMFSTAVTINSSNTRKLIKNSDFNMFVKSEKQLNIHNSFYKAQGIAGINKKEPDKAIFEKAKGVDLYLPKNDINLNETIFNKKNWVKGSFEDLKRYGDTIGIAIDYKTLKKLGLKENSDFIISIPNNKNNATFEDIKCTVKGILLTSPNDLGIVVMGKDAEYDALFKDLNISNISFLKENISNLDISASTTKEQMLLQTKIPLKNTIANVIFPIMGGLLTFLLIIKDLIFNINRSKKSIAILNSLGVNYNNINKALMFYEGIDILIGGFISVILYKYIIFQKYIQVYVTTTFLIYVLLGTLFVGLSALLISFLYLNKKLPKMSIIDILSTKELI